MTYIKTDKRDVRTGDKIRITTEGTVTKTDIVNGFYLSNDEVEREFFAHVSDASSVEVDTYYVSGALYEDAYGSVFRRCDYSPNFPWTSFGGVPVKENVPKKPLIRLVKEGCK